jgi:polar amino acid transport system substrate-binding protein
MRKILFFVSIFFVAAVANASETLVFSMAEESMIQDISAQVLVEAYNKIGYKVELKRFPNARSLFIANMGEVDGEVSRIKGLNKQFVNLRRVPVAVNILEARAFSKKTDTKITNWESLRKHKLLCVRGVKFIEANLAKRNIYCEDVTSFAQAVKILQWGRSDIAVLPKINGLNAIKEEKAQDVKVVGNQLITKELFHYLHKKHINIMAEIQVVLSEMEKSGRMAQIREEYLEKHTL